MLVTSICIARNNNKEKCLLEAQATHVTPFGVQKESMLKFW